jgi:preprotein translocase subunit SecB
MKMQTSPLQLEAHHFTRIDISVQEGEVEKSDLRFSCETGYAVDEENPRRHRVSLKLVLEARPETRPPYVGEVEAVGYFKVLEGWPEEKIIELVSVNGPSVLYGAIREMILNMTGRFPHGAIQIPAVRFPPMEKEEPKKKAKKKVALKRVKSAK